MIVRHEILTARLRMRCWMDRDREPFAAMNADPEVMAYFPSTLGRADSDAGIDVWLGHFIDNGWGNWALELRESGAFIGYTGLTVPRRMLPFSPCVEIGWRLARPYWSAGYATEAATEALRIGFDDIGLNEIVSFTSRLNARSRAVMERIGMRDAGEDFDHPALPAGHRLQRHCLYRLDRDTWLDRATRG